MSQEEPNKLNDFLNYIRGILKQEHDLQWVALTCFVVFAIVGAFAINESMYMPGWKSYSLNESDGQLLDLEWDSTGENGLGIYVIEGDYIIKELPSGNEISIVGEPTCIDYSEGKWLIGTENGGIFEWGPNDSTISDSGISWKNNMSPEFIVDITSSDGGDSGYIITQPITGSPVLRSFFLNEISLASTGLDENIKLKAIEITPGGNAIAIGTLNSHLGYNPTLGSTGEVVVETWVEAWGNSSMGIPKVQILHSATGASLHSLMILNEEWGSDKVAIAAGASSTLVIHSDHTVSEVSAGSAAAAIDNTGAIWLAAQGGKGQVSILEPGEESVSTFKLTTQQSIISEKGVTAGDSIEFYGTDSSGNEQKAVVNTNSRNTPLTSISVLGEITFVFVSLIIFCVMGWNFYENWERRVW